MAHEMIPRILHRVVGRNPREDEERYWSELQAMHPGWEFRSWQDPLNLASFEYGPEIKAARSGAERADIIRLEVLLREGGVYVDADCRPIRPFDSLLGHSLFIGTEDGARLTNAVIGCIPNHPGIREYLEVIRTESRVHLAAPPNETTGPFLATRVLGTRTDITVLPPDSSIHYPSGTRGRETTSARSPRSFTSGQGVGRTHQPRLEEF